MKYISTRGSSPAVSISQAMDAGLAPDGGLYVPEFFPIYSGGDFDLVKTLAPFFEGDPLAAHLKEICANAFNFPTPLNDGVLELFHGPTAAFKDVGARFLAESQSRLSQRKRTVLVATSGDTGGAVAAAYHGRPHFEVIILFPKGMVSARQQQQLTCWGENIRAYAVKGTFDDCQRMAKDAFQDSRFKNAGLTSANSINIGRLLPQMTYYARASVEYQKQHQKIPSFIIPSGNLGNAVAALWAKKMGFPIGQIVMATNANRAVPDYLQSGIITPHETISTLANAMDVGKPSNLERAIHLYPQIQDFRNDVSAISVSDEEIRNTIKKAAKEGKVFCPHTATAVQVRESIPSDHWIVVATAHPAKFETIVEPLIGKKVEVPAVLTALLNKKSIYTEIGTNLSEVN
jgi:threonine synthase